MINKKDEIVFWSRQMSEHALFLHLGLEKPDIKAEAKKLHEKWEKFRKSGHSEKQLSSLLPELKSFKKRILNRLNNGEWLGWIFSLFADHILRELEFFEKKLKGHVSEHEELLFWKRINQDHADFTAHLLDPQETKLIDKAQDTSKRFHRMGEDVKTLRALSLNASKEMDKFTKAGEEGIKAKKIKTVIHPVLISHVVREEERSVEKIKETIEYYKSKPHGKMTMREFLKP